MQSSFFENSRTSIKNSFSVLIGLFLLTSIVTTSHANGNGLDEEPDSYMHPDIPVAGFMERAGLFNDYEDASHWISLAKKKLRQKIRRRPIEKQAKNVIFFLGDGMSIPTVTAARIFKGQNENLTFGEEAELYFEKFPYSGMSKTFCANFQVGDSACTATAYLSGAKGNYRTIGVSPAVEESNCAAQMDRANHLSSILEWAQAAGMSTGIVTNTRVTHASPAGAYSHIAHRNWEYDRPIRSAGFDPDFCDDIAEQLIFGTPGKGINVIMGGGRSVFLDEDLIDVEEGKRGKRGDGKNLIEAWVTDKAPKGGVYVASRNQLLALNTSKTDYLLGLFSYDHMEYHDKLAANNDPTLEEMTQVAIEILRKNPRGYFLFVEGGKIDHAHHGTQAKRALIETLEFDKAIKRGREMTKEDETLVLVTADHSHVMTISGYGERGNSILGLGGMSNMDGLPYTTLSYANGPGYRRPKKGSKRHNVINDNILDINYRQVATVPMLYETHGGDDVLIFASGPFAHLFTGSQDQTFIPHAMAYAACIGSGDKFCDRKTN